MCASADTLLGNLTVAEMLTYTAEMRNQVRQSPTQRGSLCEGLLCAPASARTAIPPVMLFDESDKTLTSRRRGPLDRLGSMCESRVATRAGVAAGGRQARARRGGAGGPGAEALP